MSAHPASPDGTREDAVGRVGSTVSGTLALPCALLALVGFGLVHRLGYFPAVIAVGLLTLVIWLGIVDTFARGPVALRVVTVLVVAYASTALFWATVPGWTMIPVLWSVLAAISTRTTLWVVTSVLCAVFGTGIIALIL